VVWLPLKPDLRINSKYNPDRLAEWVTTLDEQTQYSFIKEFFAAVDDKEHGWPAPFNFQSVPILLRLLEKYWVSNNKAEFVEALQLRYVSLLKE
jgi:hypothetical protein